MILKIVFWITCCRTRLIRIDKDVDLFVEGVVFFFLPFFLYKKQLGGKKRVIIGMIEQMPLQFFPKPRAEFQLITT